MAMLTVGLQALLFVDADGWKNYSLPSTREHPISFCLIPSKDTR